MRLMNRRAATVVVLPNEIDGLDAVTRALDEAEWGQLVTALQAPDAVKMSDLALPRFKASFGRAWCRNSNRPA
jgi:hypothetical protein